VTPYGPNFHPRRRGGEGARHHSRRRRQPVERRLGFEIQTTVKRATRTDGRLIIYLCGTTQRRREQQCAAALRRRDESWARGVAGFSPLTCTLSCTRLQNYTIGASLKSVLVSVLVPCNSSLCLQRLSGMIQSWNSMGPTPTRTLEMCLSCNFVNGYTMAYRVQYRFTRVHACIANGYPPEEKRACWTSRRTSQRGSSCLSCSW